KIKLEIPPAARLFTAAATLAAVPVPRPRRTPPARRSSGSLNLAGTRPNRLFSMYRPPNAFGVPLQHPPPQPSPWQWQQPPEPSPAVSFWQSDNVRDHVKKLQGTIEVSTALINELEEITATRNSGDAVAQESDLYSMELSSESADSSVDKPLRHFVELARSMGLTQDTHESMAADAANYLCHQLQQLL
ncbi:unnamed protein product, partial [Urochloa humidicola]